MVVYHGTGTPVQFTSGDDRNVLEMGKLIHTFESKAPGAPILTIGSRAYKKITPVSEFYHMEDEYFIRKSETFTMSSIANLVDSKDTGVVNDKGCILIVDRLPQLELFEKGGVYTVTAAGGANIYDFLAFLCIAVGKECSATTPTDKMVQFIGIDTISGDTYTYHEHATGVDLINAGYAGTITLTYVGNASTSSGGTRAMALAQTGLTDAETFDVLALTGHSEGGALSYETRKKVRRIKNCVEIFKESYEITNSEVTELMYGGDERTRRSNRKLKKLRSDIEWAILTHEAPSYDSSTENPKRKMGGFGVGGTNGFIQSNNADIDSNLQLTESSFTCSDFNSVMTRVFRDESSAEKDFFVGVDFMTSMARAILAQNSTTFVYDSGKDIHAGTRIASYRAPIGKVNFIHHKMFEGKLAKYGLLIDWGNLAIRPKRGRELQKAIDCVKAGQDGVVDEWRYEGSIEVHHENTFAIIKLT